MASGGNIYKPLSYDGSASPKTVFVGFTPRTVRVTSMDDGSEVFVDELLSQQATVAQRGGLKVNGADGVRSWLTLAEGITIVDGGFEVGTDAACNDAGVQFHVIVTD